MPKADKRPTGRPSKYERRYCEEVVADMADGFSLTAFAGKIGVSRSTINEWIDQFPEFSEAVSRAKAARLRKWEEMGHKIADKGTGGPGGATMVVFGLKNMGGDEWSAPERRELTGKDGEALPAAQVTIFALPDNGRDRDG